MGIVTLLLFDGLCPCVVSNQSLIARFIFPDDNHHVANPGIIRELCFDLFEFNPEAADLHLKIIAPDKINCSVFFPPAQIACLVHPCARFA